MPRWPSVVIVLFIWTLTTHGKFTVSGDEPHYLIISESLLADGDLDGQSIEVFAPALRPHEAAHGAAARNEGPDDVGADEAGAAGDEIHGTSLSSR